MRYFVIEKDGKYVKSTGLDTSANPEAAKGTLEEAEVWSEKEWFEEGMDADVYDGERVVEVKFAIAGEVDRNSLEPVKRTDTERHFAIKRGGRWLQRNSENVYGPLETAELWTEDRWKLNAIQVRPGEKVVEIDLGMTELWLVDKKTLKQKLPRRRK